MRKRGAFFENMCCRAANQFMDVQFDTKNSNRTLVLSLVSFLKNFHVVSCPSNCISVIFQLALVFV